MTGNEPITVLLADDHPIVRYSLRQALEEDPQLKVIGEASDGREALRLVNSLEPDVLLLDLEMPEMSGVEVVEELELAETQTRTLVISGHADERYLNHLISLGIEGYLLKEETPDVFIEAIKGIHQGQGGWYSRPVMRQMAVVYSQELQEERRLTPRQKLVLESVAKGKTNNEVGYLLGVSEKTIEKHLGEIIKKLGVATRVEAVVLAIRNQWIVVEH